MAVGGDRNEARKEYEMNLAKFHTGRGAPNEALREKNKLRNRGEWQLYGWYHVGQRVCKSFRHQLKDYHIQILLRGIVQALRRVKHTHTI